MKERGNNRVKIIYDELYTTHYITASCEIPSRVEGIMDTLSEFYETVKPEACSDDDILLCHSEGLLTIEKQNQERYIIARLAAGGAITAARMALNGDITFAAIRPPGHHANPDHNWGFCFFNNMGIAIKKLISESLITKAVILDIDLHFGDGTDTIFKHEGSVKVYNIQSTTSDDFIKETEYVLHGAGNADIIGISAGFDNYIQDWGGCLSTEDFFTIGEIAGTYAAKKCSGRIFTLLEGGYYIPDLGINAHSLIQGIIKGLNSTKSRKNNI